jgi:hypothetical protein
MAFWTMVHPLARLRRWPQVTAMVALAATVVLAATAAAAVTVVLAALVLELETPV